MLVDHGGEYLDQQRISTFMQSVILATESALLKTFDLVQNIAHYVGIAKPSKGQNEIIIKSLDFGNLLLGACCEGSEDT